MSFASLVLVSIGVFCLERTQEEIRDVRHFIGMILNLDVPTAHFYCLGSKGYAYVRRNVDEKT